MSIPLLFAKRRFNPRRLFAAGEQGVWYDPSDFSTMFQDSAGTTPVTAIEQPVGLILDKSGRGNHASQSTTTSRPILRNRYNLLTYTEQFDNAYWTKFNLLPFGSGSVANTTATTNPLGGNTADFIVPNGTSGSHRVFSPNGTITAASKIVLSCYVKAGGYSKVALIENQATGAYASFDLSNGSSIASGGGIGTVSDVSATPVGNGWYHLSMGVTPTTSVGMRLDVYILPSTYTSGDPALVNWSGNGTSGAYLWGASLVVANESSLPYQWVTTGAEYTGSPVTAGYDTDVTKFPPYLFFDGSDDWLQTGNINFSTTDKMSVFAGVRKLSDASALPIATSKTTETDYFFAGGCVSVGASSRQNWAAANKANFGGTTTAFAAPDTRVATWLFDLAQTTPAAEMLLRLNGAQQALTFFYTTHSSGNYYNAPLYIGAVDGAGSYLYGRIYSLIIRGALTSSPQLEQTERWVNSKTGAY